ncbi:TetR/AcrR family transcriptional regulator C-terminal domain-containing protein [Leucobacter allii]|uniref:TetR/AcrR family transcriptional regulator C-terminal domain-containing protein n=1 Tax=Leucobacter allii TaxID=2932247 RepID=A0ABY4FKP2_9MICO|nr:TetR/AcrR family transcriptional regulator C-terminal domain-containing protein [Leucobacter allii]UOQ56828.1 TetR/AcrR family transcriptional regulator C-terminal domain-containing protein [Leucobacter allii]UOR01291.1 TetR/AcrR family transcriptional regulator C-terminal domain-containing protein [Leucobacter allii]
MARPRTARLSPERIGREAIALVEGGQELQLIPLARRLGVSVSSLYHHVDGREGVIHAMRRELVARHLAPTADAGDWEARIRQEVERTWRMYAEHPRVLQHMLTVVIDEPDVLRFYSALAAALDEAGLPEEEIVTAIEVIDAFSFGAALDALSPDEPLDSAAVDPRLAALLATHPRGAARNRRVFDAGLELLLAGIRARAAAARSVH